MVYLILLKCENINQKFLFMKKNNHNTKENYTPSPAPDKALKEQVKKDLSESQDPKAELNTVKAKSHGNTGFTSLHWLSVLPSYKDVALPH